MLRSLTKSDLAQLLTIEQSVHVVPWTEETFKICFESGYLGWAVEIDTTIAGFIIVSQQADECHILNVCVARPHQHQGLGTKLMERALSHARQRGVGLAYLEVRKSNSHAIAMYKKMKFHLIGERKDYYPTVNGQEDALIFAKNLREEI